MIFTAQYSVCVNFHQVFKTVYSFFLLYLPILWNKWMRKVGCLILLIFFPLIAFNAWGQSRRALLIGIGNYPEDSGWSIIHGNNDLTIIKPFLIRQGFSEDSIIQLIDSEATKDNILRAFDELLAKSMCGDVIYIHFSGHGQQISDLDGDEEDGFDESWIPFDAKKNFISGMYEGEKHLIDDELNLYFSKLRKRIGNSGKLIIVADACHSGSGSRNLSDDDVFIRGTGDKFIIPHKENSLAHYSKPAEWLFIAACKSYQSNYEFRTASGEYYGVLSYVIAKEQKSIVFCNYSDLLCEWSNEVSERSRYPQDLDIDGQPCRKSLFMF